ncbi:MAG TPA: tetratricopeptide repeat protein [Thermoanaerobaculia bacterium]|nr:tetratricopeptide repeat protein [Thermoanaerobaculia bacterium]
MKLMLDFKRRSRVRHTSLGATLLAVAGAMALGGCATGGPPDQGDRSQIAPTLQARGVDPNAVVIPYELTDEMREWVHRMVPRNLSFDRRLPMLVDALLSEKGLNVTYEAKHTGTAEEVFKTRRANCLAFTSLFVAMSREVGVPAFFLDVQELERFEKEGDLVVVSGHVSAGYGIGKTLQVLDFSSVSPTSGYQRRVFPISDVRAIALYHSNRGAEALRAGNEEEALDWLHKAVAIDPEVPGAWINYGVALRRSGKDGEAENAYRKALEIDSGAVSAYQNLASLLRYKGRTQEAEQLMALTLRMGTRNPYNYLALGDLSLSHGRFDEARRYYKRAMRLYRDNPEPYAALGIISLIDGDRLEATKWLRKASAIDQENNRVKQLQARLGSQVG